MNKLISIFLSTLLIGTALQAMDVARDAGEQLVQAAMDNDLAVVKILIEKGVNTNYQSDGRSALMVAAIRGNTEICKLLIANGANINLRSNIQEGQFAGESALMGAARRGNLEICKLLLEHGADVNQLDNYGRTALQEAISWGRLDVCKLLIDATLKAPIDPARLARINLTPTQRNEVVAFMASLKKNKSLKKTGQGVKGAEFLQPDTITLMGQTLSNAYKLKNMIRAQLEEIAQRRPDTYRELLNYLDRK